MKGRVLDANGEPCSGATVAVLPSVYGAMSRMETQSAADGRYELRGLTPGSVDFEVQDEDWARTLRHRVLVTSGQVTMWNPVLPDPKILRGRLQSESGMPLVGWRVATRPIVDGVVARVSMGTRTGSEGRFTLNPDFGTYFEVTFGPPGAFSLPALTVESMEISDEDRTYVVPDDRIPTAGVLGRIVNAEGQGIAATIDVGVGGSEPRHFEVRAGADGTFQARYLSAATFELTVWRTASRSGWSRARARSSRTSSGTWATSPCVETKGPRRNNFTVSGACRRG